MSLKSCTWCLKCREVRQSHHKQIFAPSFSSSDSFVYLRSPAAFRDIMTAGGGLWAKHTLRYSKMRKSTEISILFRGLRPFSTKTQDFAKRFLALRFCCATTNKIVPKKQFPKTWKANLSSYRPCKFWGQQASEFTAIIHHLFHNHHHSWCSGICFRYVSGSLAHCSCTAFVTAIPHPHRDSPHYSYFRHMDTKESSKAVTQKMTSPLCFIRGKNVQ